MPFHTKQQADKLVSLVLSSHHGESLPNVHSEEMYYDISLPLPFNSANFIWNNNKKRTKQNTNCSMAINYWFYIENHLGAALVSLRVSVAVLGLAEVEVGLLRASEEL